MELSPFPYQGPLQPEQVHGRDDLIRDLTERVTARRVTALLGPRRFGKTSVLGRVAADLTEVETVWVDLYEVTSIADVAVRFDDALASTSGQFAAEARAIAATLSINLGLVKVDLTRPARQRRDPKPTFDALLDILVKAALRHPTLLVIDEFSSIAHVDGARGALRTALQHHYNELGVVFAGSYPSMMRALFSARAEPFYGQADLVHIDRLTSATVERIISEGFATTGRDAGNLAPLIMSFTGGHPQRTMQLADACWRHTRRGAVAVPRTWETALAEVRRAEADAMEMFYARFTGGQRAVLRAVAGSGTIYGTKSVLLDIASGTATHARDGLLDSGDLESSDSGLVVVDPLFADWLRERFPI